MVINPSNSYDISINMQQHGSAFPEVLTTISHMEARIGAIDIVKIEQGIITRDVIFDTMDENHAQAISDAVAKIPEVSVRHLTDRTFMLHLGGKIEIKSKVSLSHRDDLSMVYTPGVARVCMAIHDSPEKAFNLTIKKNMVAVVSDGTAVLGLGDIGPLAAMPVMEGKAMLFKKFADVDAFPICLATKDIEDIIKTVKNIAPTFGAINLEDISAPRCFEIEKRLKAELDIPVFHDDQHGTAAVLSAALINALKLVNKKMTDIKVVFNGVGAAGTACTNMLMELGVKNIVGCDRRGALSHSRTDLDATKQEYVQRTNPNNESGSLQEVIKGADVFVGLSSANILTVADLKNMNKDPIVFAMANPDPEIMPEIALPHVAIMATGRSDYPNQINNLLAFPGIFRGALDCRASDINAEMRLAAAHAIANCVDPTALSRDYIIPSVFNADVAPAVAAAVMEAAKRTGVARK
ncbi:MAG: NAD-dependent malic enzyme [Gammaproteobacteria bacterium]|nr:NAD-dependent malic enzyme [Gammaproteobacteria bacterium]